MRTTTTYLWLIYYTLVLASIMVMYYFYPDFSLPVGLVATDWSKLPLLKETNTVNMLLASTISLGWISLLLDLLLAGLKYCCRNSKPNFWDETVLLQGHKYWQSFTIFPFIFVLALALTLIFNTSFYLFNNF